MSEQHPEPDDEINELIRQINTGGGGGLGREASKARLEALHVAKLSEQLRNLSDSILGVQKVIGQRLEDLGIRIDEGRKELEQTSKSSTLQSESLILWTKRSVWALVVYVILTGGLLVTGWQQLVAAQRSFQAQVQPEVSLVIENGNLVLTNTGNELALNVYVEPTSLVFETAKNKPIASIHNLPKVPGKNIGYWWHFDKLAPGESERKGFQDLAQNILNIQRMKEESGASKAKSRLSLISFLQFTVIFHRDVDHREYRKSVTAFVAKDSVTGEALFWDAESFRYGVGISEEILKQLAH